MTIKIVDDYLEDKLKRLLGVDRDGLLEMYHSRGAGREFFNHRYFVMEEPFEAELADEVWWAFAAYDVQSSIDILNGE